MGESVILCSITQNAKTTCFMCNVISKSGMASVSARLHYHAKETPKTKVCFILMLQHCDSLCHSNYDVILCCCYERKKKSLEVWSSLTPENENSCPEVTNIFCSNFIRLRIQSPESALVEGTRKGNLTTLPEGRELKIWGVSY